MFGWIKRLFGAQQDERAEVGLSIERKVAMARAIQDRRLQRARADAIVAQNRRQRERDEFELSLQRERDVAEARRQEGLRYAAHRAEVERMQRERRQADTPARASSDSSTGTDTWVSGFYASDTSDSGCSGSDSSSASDGGSCGGGD